MRSGLLSTFVVLLAAATASATTLTDVFGQVQSNCNYSATAPYSSCDVIGDPQLYDIQKVTFSTANSIATIMIWVNSGAVQTVNQQLTLGSFTDAGLSLIPGDVFLYNPQTVYDPSDPSTAEYLKYGIALVNHGSFQAGGLYSIGGTVSVETAQQALNSDDYYRRNEAVLMTGSGAPSGVGSVTVANNVSGGANYVVTVTVPVTTGLLNLMSNGQIGLLFSSADCGNDVIQGAVGETPEPGPGLMVLTGLLTLIAVRKWRKL